MGFCDLPLVHNACDLVGGAAKSVAGDVLGTIAKAFADAAGNLLKLTMSLWTRVNVPQFDDHSGPVGLLRDHVAWLTSLIAVATVLVCCIKMGVARNHKGGVDAARGMITLIVSTAISVPLVVLLCGIGDSFSQWILDQSTGGSFNTRIGAIGGGLSVLSPGIVVLIVPLLILTSVVQIGLMVVRIAALVVLTGAAVPLSAAASGTDIGRHAHQKVWVWLAAFIAYKPVAAIIYASAFWLVGDGKDIMSVISGLVLMILAVIALPALMRLLAPISAAAISAGSGGALAGGAALAATGARMVSQSHSSHSSPSSNGSTAPAATSAPSGATPVVANGANGATGATGSAGANGAAGANASGGGAARGAASGAATAAGPVGVAVVVGETAKKTKKAVQGSVPTGEN